MAVNDEQKQSNTTRTILIILGVAVGLFCCLTVVIIIFLSLFGDVIGEFFLQIAETLEAG